MQASRPTVKYWESIFPNDQVTEQKSALFVKKLLAVAISNITYLRNIFPENAFGDKCLEDLSLKILRDESSCPGACQVIKWVKGCFDALDKKYLKSLVIGIYVDPKDPETVIESYTFKFSYKNDGSVDIYRNEEKITEAYSADETKKATVRLLRTLVILTNTLSSLPDKVMMTMKLFYYSEVTPEDYEPPGFKPANDSIFQFDEEPTNIGIGSVSTNFHTVRLRVKTKTDNFEEQNDGTENNVDNQTEKDRDGPGLSKEITNEISCEDNSTADHANNENIDNNQEMVNEEEFKVRCPCGCNSDDGLMIMCAQCQFWQHGVCFLITKEDKAPEIHYCNLCAKKDDPNCQPTDPTLCGLSALDAQDMCLWRRGLTVCPDFVRITAPELAKRLDIENTVAQGLINRLEKEGYIASSGRGKKGKLGKVVNKKKIEKEGIPHYLRTPRLQFTAKDPNDGNVNSSICSENPMDFTTSAVEKEISAITDVAKNMSLDSSKKKVIEESTKKIDRKSRGRKRARSKVDDVDFDIADSQDVQVGGKKKASKVSKDIVV